MTAHIQQVTNLKDLLLAGRNMIYPFELALTASDKLSCEKPIRILPGKRFTLQGKWQGKDVVAKIFIHPQRAHRHQRRDEKGILALQHHKISTPKIYYAGATTVKGLYVTVFEFLSSAKKIKQTWEQARNDDEQDTLISKLVHVLARQHAAGIIQNDLHLNNFLLKRGKIYCLDGADITHNKNCKALKLKPAFINLAYLIENLTNYQTEHVRKAFVEYCSYRNIAANENNYRFLNKQMQRIRKEMNKKQMAKTLRDCSSFICKKSPTSFLVYDREYDSPNMQQLMHRPETVFQGDKIEYLKQGGSSTVIRCKIDSHDLVIKRYNIKSPGHAIKRLVKTSRARQSWLSAHHLRLLDIDTLKPIGMIEKRKGLFNSQAYFITEFIEGKSLLEFCKLDLNSQTYLNLMADKFVNQLFRMHEKGFTHGDLKASNIRVNQGKAFLLDLDAVKWHKNKKTLNKFKDKDLQRFLKNFADFPALNEYWTQKLSKR